MEKLLMGAPLILSPVVKLSKVNVRVDWAIEWKGKTSESTKNTMSQKPKDFFISPSSVKV